MQLIIDWFKRTFSDAQVVFLALVLCIGLAIILVMGNMLAPLIASIVIAYLLEGLVVLLERLGLSRWLATTVVFSIFMLVLSWMLFGLLPLLSIQLTQLGRQLPSIINEGQNALIALPQNYPDFFSPAQVQELSDSIRRELINFGQNVLTFSLSSVVGVITIVVYLILMPLLVFFFLKDKDQILTWLKSFMPTERSLANNVWFEVDRQIVNYMRGKFWEILIVWAVSFITFLIFGLEYAMLLSVLVGLSVLVPYVGAIVVTIPVLLIAWFQWGWSSDFIWLTVVYLIIHMLDGNVLVPILFSEAVSLHPVAIIVAILVFGGLWGFWGIFFAIPLATLVNAILRAWPQHSEQPV